MSAKGLTKLRGRPQGKVVPAERFGGSLKKIWDNNGMITGRT